MGLSDGEFERLFDENAAQLLSFLTLRTGNRAAAEDLVADAFERVLRQRHRFDSRRGTAKSWLYSISLNLLRDNLRRERTHKRALREIGDHPASGHDPGLDQIEDRDALSGPLASLSAEEREAVSLRYGADLTLPEIAELIGQPLSTVEGRVYGALRKLRDRISGSSVGNRGARSYQGSEGTTEVN